jgi:hypothetical protein
VKRAEAEVGGACGCYLDGVTVPKWVARHSTMAAEVKRDDYTVGHNCQQVTYVKGSQPSKRCFGSTTWSSKWAPWGVHCMDCFLAKRLLSKELTSDSTKAVEIAWPARGRAA